MRHVHRARRCEVVHLAFVLGILGVLMTCRADLGLRLLQGDSRVPACRLLGHGVDDVDLDAVGHAIQRHVLSSGRDGEPVRVALGPALVPLLAHRLLIHIVTLRRIRNEET